MYEKELNALKNSHRLRKRQIYKQNCIDGASNDYLGLSTKKSILKKSIKAIQKQKRHSSTSSMLVNGYFKWHRKLENKLRKINNFEACIIIGSGFLANISLIESLSRKNDTIFVDKSYHASGMSALKMIQAQIIIFEHNNPNDLEQKIKQNTSKRKILAIEGVYSMSGDIAHKKFADIAKKYNMIFIVDEAHSSGVIGNNLLGYFDYHNIKIQPNFIKMGTLSKAYGSYGAYILSSKTIIDFLLNRGKPIIYSSALSIFDTILAYYGIKYITKHRNKIKHKLDKIIKIASKIFNKQLKTPILTINTKTNKNTKEIQNALIKRNFIIGAIRQPTVNNPILRIVLNTKLNIRNIKKMANIIQKQIRQT